MGNAKIKCMKIVFIIDANVVRGRLSKNLSRNIFDTKYSRFTVSMFQAL